MSDTERALAGALELLEIFRTRLDAAIRRRELYSHAAANATQLMEAETDVRAHHRVCSQIELIQTALASHRGA